MNKEHTGAVPQAPALNGLQSAARRWLSLLDRHPYQSLLIMMLFAGALGLAKLWIDPPSWEFNWENRWWQIAVDLTRGNGYVSCKQIYFPFCGPENQVTAMREPLPVFVFALVARLTGESLLAASAVVVFTNLLIIPAVFFLASELSNRRAGLLAALLWSVYLGPVRALYNLVSGDLLASFFLIVGLFFLLRARRTNKTKLWLAAGVCMGLAALSRSAFLVTGLVLALGLVVWPSSGAKPGEWARINRLKPAVIFALALSITFSPWLIRNLIAFQQPVIGSTLSGYYLYRQNRMLPQENYIRFVTGAAFVPVLEDVLARRADIRGTENEAQMDRVYRQEALEIIRANPARYVVLSASRFLMLWFNWRVNEEYDRQNNLVDWLILLQHGLLLVFFWSGFVGRWNTAWPLAACIAAYHLLYMAVMAHLPYLIPIMPLIVALSAAGTARILSNWSAGNRANEGGDIR